MSNVSRLLVSLLCILFPARTSWGQQTISVLPGQNLQALVNLYPPSTTFSLAAGEYRLQSVVPRSYDSFVGQTGAILSGAALLTNFSASNSYWVSHVQVYQAASYPGTCGSANPACAFPEDLFFDNTPKTRVTNLSAVGPGTWYLDYSSGSVYMGDDPAGHTVEISLLAYAFSGTASSVTISNLIIEKYACVAGDGAVDSSQAAYWDVGGNEIRYNHGTGVRTGSGIYVHDNKVHHNGDLGVGGFGNSLLVQSNEISFNNYSGYSIYWEAGGAKFIGAQNVTFRYNYSHDNAGPGFWTDLGAQNVICDSNQFSGNEEAAILNELSYTTTISNNYIWNDGFSPDGSGLWWGAGILVSDSSSISVVQNNLSYCMNGIVGILANRGNAPNGQPYTLQNVDVQNNTITQSTGTAAGIAVEGTGFDNSVYTNWNNQFQQNTFNLANPSYDYFWWLGEPMTYSAWTNALASE